MKIPYFSYKVTLIELYSIYKTLKSGWLTTSKMAEKLEAQFKEYTGAKYALAVNSCTSALHLAALAVGIKKGDKVLVPNITFIATAEILSYMNAVPVFVDVEPDSGLLSVKHITDAINKHKNIKAIIYVVFAGQSSHLSGPDGLIELCKKRNIKLIIDAAHAFPSISDAGVIGSFGDITCFSFYANKTLTTAEGGMVVTNDEVYSDKISLMRLHGINKQIWSRYTSEPNKWEYDVVIPGYKYNLADLNASIGVVQFPRASSSRKKRQIIAEKYIQLLSKQSVIKLPNYTVNPDWHSWHLFHIYIPSFNQNERNILIEKMDKCGIGLSVHYKPLHMMGVYKEKFGLSNEEFTGSMIHWNTTVSLPIYHTLKMRDVYYIVKMLLRNIEEIKLSS